MASEPLKISLPIMQKKRRPLWIWGVAALVVLGLAGAGLWWWQSQILDSAALVESAPAPLTAMADGRVAEVPVALNQLVQAGQPVLHLDSAPFMARLAEARARLDAVVPGQQSSTSVRSAEQSLQAAAEQSRQQEQLARRDMEHFAALHAQAMLEVRRLDIQKADVQRKNAARLAEIEARVGLDNARTVFNAQSRARTLADGDLLRFRTDMRNAAQLAQNPEVLARVQEVLAARVAEAEADIAATVVAAPQEGQLTRLDVSPGSMVRRGQTVGEITPSRVRVLAHVSAAEAARIQPGQSARVRFIGLAEQPFSSAEVAGILPPDEQGRVPVRVVLTRPMPQLPTQNSVVEVRFTPF